MKTEKTEVDVFTIIYNSALDQFYIEQNLKHLEYYASVFMVVVQQLSNREEAYAILQELNRNDNVKAVMKTSFGLEAQVSLYKDATNKIVLPQKTQVDPKEQTYIEEPSTQGNPEIETEDSDIPDTNAIGIITNLGESIILQFSDLLKDVRLMYVPPLENI